MKEDIKTWYIWIDWKISYNCNCDEYKWSWQCRHTARELRV